MRIGSIIIFHLSKLWKAKLVIKLCIIFWWGCRGKRSLLGVKGQSSHLVNTAIFLCSGGRENPFQHFPSFQPHQREEWPKEFVDHLREKGKNAHNFEYVALHNEQDEDICEYTDLWSRFIKCKFRSLALTLSLWRMIHFKLPLQPTNITSHSMKNLAFHRLLRWSIHFSLKGWETALH